MKYLKEYNSLWWEVIDPSKLSSKIYGSDIYLFSDKEIKELSDFFSQYKIEYKVLGVTISKDENGYLSFHEDDGTNIICHEFHIYDGDKVEHYSPDDYKTLLSYTRVERFTFYVKVNTLSKFYINRYDDDWYYVFANELARTGGNCFKCDELFGVKKLFEDLFQKFDFKNSNKL